MSRPGESLKRSSSRAGRGPCALKHTAAAPGTHSHRSSRRIEFAVSVSACGAQSWQRAFQPARRSHQRHAIRGRAAHARRSEHVQRSCAVHINDFADRAGRTARVSRRSLATRAAGARVGYKAAQPGHERPYRPSPPLCAATRPRPRQVRHAADSAPAACRAAAMCTAQCTHDLSAAQRLSQRVAHAGARRRRSSARAPASAAPAQPR